MNRSSLPDIQRPFQVSMKWCFIAIAIAAILIVLNQRSLGVLASILAPHGIIGYLAIVSFVTANYCLAVRSAREFVWTGFLVAWCLTLIDALLGIVASITVFGNVSPKAVEMLSAYEAILSGVVLPGLLTSPIVYRVLRRGVDPLSKGSCWLTMAVLLAFLDVILNALLTASIFGARIMRDGTVQWVFGPH
ncbi:MAG: hypothetical protein KDA42_00770 [Planctomycetales bacterium]|nr:hypothetical protein [Planctomycetales bacterium]